MSDRTWLGLAVLLFCGSLLVWLVSCTYPVDVSSCVVLVVDESINFPDSTAARDSTEFCATSTTNASQGRRR